MLNLVRRQKSYEKDGEVKTFIEICAVVELADGSHVFIPFKIDYNLKTLIQRDLDELPLISEEHPKKK